MHRWFPKGSDRRDVSTNGKTALGDLVGISDPLGEQPNQLERFAFPICALNAVVGAVDPKALPVILHRVGKDASLTGNAAKALAPVANGSLRVVT